MTSEKKIWVALIAVAIIAIGGYFFPTALKSVFGGVTNYDEVDTTALKVGGANGSRIGPVITSTCSLIAASFTVTASTTAYMDCAVTGVVSGDGVFAQFATSSAIFNGWSVASASASTTSGFLTIGVSNGTGANNVIPASVASSTKFIVLHPVTSVPGL